VDPPHEPVLADVVARFVAGGSAERVVDCTVGAGGHARIILSSLAADAELLGIDRDEEAIALARERLAEFGDRVHLVKGDFGDLEEIVGERGWGRGTDAVLYDFGVSSMQFDRPERGFSYQHDAPLDMRMDRARELTAAEVLNTYSERDLTRVLREYGEERWAARIAKFIVRARARRPLSTTRELVELVRDAVPSAARRGGPHPARRTFQALRIEVNRELDAIQSSLPQAVAALRPGGRLVALSYHSLEDRIVKQTFRSESEGEAPRLRVLTRKPERPDEDEIRINPRASAAKLRAAERISSPDHLGPQGPSGGSPGGRAA
jgi:16S rRNA (cytosine1402-N4)-methyltransferase